MAAAAEYDLRTQAKIPGALGALHNFIRIKDPDDEAQEEDDYGEGNDDPVPLPDAAPIPPENLGQHVSQAEKLRASARRDAIAQAMWVNYVEELRQRGEL